MCEHLQAGGYALRVSCATPGVGPLLGMAGVGFASALAGEASRRYGAHAQGARLQWRPRELAADAAMDAIVGITLFKARLCGLAGGDGMQHGACTGSHLQCCVALCGLSIAYMCI